MRYVRALFVLLIAGFFVFGGNALVQAQSADELQEQIDASNKQIEQIRKEIAELQSKLTTTAAERQTLQTAINGLNLSIQKLQKNISLTQAQIREKDLEIGDLSNTIGETTDRIGLSEKSVGEMLRELHAHDNKPIMLTFFAEGSLSSFFDEMLALTTLRDRLGNRISDLENLKSDLETNKDAAEEKRTELASLSERLGDEREGLNAAKSEQNKLLEVTKNKEAEYQAQLALKQAEQKAFEARLFELASQLEYTLDPNKFARAGRGVLQWPLDSVYITQQFGRTADSGRLYTSGTHDGIDFRATVGTPVRAALSGVVQEVNHGAVQNCQYGKWVLVKHGNGITTLYAHLSQIDVEKGETVATGKVIGFAGNTGYATGPHLHFTVYISDALSLRQYTCRSGYTVTIPIAPINAYLNPLSYLPSL